jgi:hypothetical protein
MIRSRLYLTLFLALGVGTSPMLVRDLAAQSEARIARAKAALPAEAARELERALSHARSQGIPTAPLVDKVLEGTAKGIPADRILAVVHDLSRELERATELLTVDGPAPVADIVAVSDALRRGVPAEAVRSLRSGRPQEPIALAVHTLADLLDRGVPVDNALDVLGAWHSQGARLDQLRDIPAAVERLIREGALPAQAATAVATTVRGGQGPAGGGPPGVVNARSKANGPPNVPPGLGKGNNKGKGKGPPGGGA